MSSNWLQTTSQSQLNPPLPKIENKTMDWWTKWQANEKNYDGWLMICETKVSHLRSPELFYLPMFWLEEVTVEVVADVNVTVSWTEGLGAEGPVLVFDVVADTVAVGGVGVEVLMLPDGWTSPLLLSKSYKKRLFNLEIHKVSVFNWFKNDEMNKRKKAN